MCSVSNSCLTLWPHELARFFTPRNFPGKNIEVGCHFLLQGIFPTQGLNPGLQEWSWICTNWDWCWEWLKAGAEGDNKVWECWMASQTQRMWVRVNSPCWWWTGSPCVLQSMGLQRVRYNWATELNWTKPPGKPDLGKIKTNFKISFIYMYI